MKAWIKTNSDQNKFGSEQIRTKTNLHRNKFAPIQIHGRFHRDYYANEIRGLGFCADETFMRSKLLCGPGLGTLDGLLPTPAPVCTF